MIFLYDVAGLRRSLKMALLLLLSLLLPAVTTAMVCTHRYQDEPWTNPNLTTCNPVGAHHMKMLCSVLGYNFAIEWHRSSTRDEAGSNGETVNEGGRYSVTSEVLRWRLAVIGRVSELTITNVTEEDLGYYWCVVVKDSNRLPNPSRILHLTNFCASSTVCGSLQLNNRFNEPEFHCATDNKEIILQNPSILQTKCVQPTSTPANVQTTYTQYGPIPTSTPSSIEATNAQYGPIPTTHLLLPPLNSNENIINTSRSNAGSSTIVNGADLHSPPSTPVYTQLLPTSVVSDDVDTQQLIWMSVGIAIAIVLTSIVFIIVLIMCIQYKKRRVKGSTVVSAIRSTGGRRSGPLEESEQKDGSGDQHEYTEIPTFLGHLANGNTSHAYRDVEDNIELIMVTPSNQRPGTYEEILELPETSAVHRHKYDLVVGNQPSNYHRLQRNSLNQGTRVSLHSNIGPQISNTFSEATDVTVVDIEPEASQPKIDIYQSDSSSGISSSSEANDYKYQEEHPQSVADLSDPDFTQSETLYDRPYHRSNVTLQQSSLDHENIQDYGQLGGHSHPRKETSILPVTSNTGSQLESLEDPPQTKTGDYNHLRPKSRESTALTPQSEPLSEFEALYASPTVAGVKHPKIMEKAGSGTGNYYHVLEGPETQVITADNLGGSSSENSHTAMKDFGEYSRLDHPNLPLENGFSANETVFEVLYDQSKVANSYPAQSAVNPQLLTAPNSSPESPLRPEKGQGKGYDHLEPQVQAGPRHQYTSINPSFRDCPSQNMYAQPIVSTPDLYISERGHVYHVLENK